MSLLSRLEAQQVQEMKALAVTFKTQYLVECGDEIIGSTDSLVEAATIITELGSGIHCVATLMSRNGDTFEVIESFFDGKPHRSTITDEQEMAAVAAILNNKK